MVKYIVNRVLVTIPIIIAIILIVFLLLQVLPGNPIQVMMKEKVNQQVIDRVTEQMGLNDPLMIRFGRYLWNMLHGDLGQSYKLKRPVTQLIMTAFPNTVKLAITSALVAWIIGIPTGIISAIKKDSLLDRILMGFSLVGISLPVFWAAMLLQYFLGYKLKLLPISGYSTIRHMIMPAIVLGWASSGSIARLTRSSLLGVMKNDYIRTARAKGLVESAVGARLLALGPDLGFTVQWWREGNDEVDFVLAGEGKLAAIEVKSGRTKSQGGMAAFLREYPEATRIVVGGSAAGAVTVEDFLLGNITLPWS